MELIDREELKEKLDRGDDFKLVLALHDWAFEAIRIPGSINVTSIKEAGDLLDPGDDIVVYCSDVACFGSRLAYNYLVENGYDHVRRYEGGLTDWQDAGYPLEGTMIDKERELDERTPALDET